MGTEPEPAPRRVPAGPTRVLQLVCEWPGIERQFYTFVLASPLEARVTRTPQPGVAPDTGH